MRIVLRRMMVSKALFVGVMIILLAFMNDSGGEETSSVCMVFLNHFFLVLDSETYSCIENSEFLQNDFAVFERRTTVRSDITYTGIYFYGSNTYFEFFDAGKIFWGGKGTSGIAFSVDERGALNALQAGLPPQLSMSADSVTRQLGEKQIPWFSSLHLDKSSFFSTLWTWIMEYDPRFLAQWHQDLDAENRGVARGRILDRYARFLKKDLSQTYFEDVVGITVAVDSTTNAEFTKLCRFFEYRIATKKDTTLLRGPDIEIILVPETVAARGIQNIIMRVRRGPKDTRRIQFGPGSILEFHDNGLATWSF